MMEIGVGFGIIRLSSALLNEGLRKTTGKEIKDDILFWGSLAPWAIVKAIHSLGYISLFGIHDHMDKPVPGMLFGQGVAATVLIGTHYAVKNREPIINFAKKTVTNSKEATTKAARFTSEKLKEKKKAAKRMVDTGINMTKNMVKSGRKRVKEPIEVAYTRIKTRLSNEWNSTPLNIRTSFKNASGALVLESLLALGGQNFLYPTLFLGFIGLMNGLSYKLDTAKGKTYSQAMK